MFLKLEANSTCKTMSFLVVGKNLLKFKTIRILLNQKMTYFIGITMG